MRTPPNPPADSSGTGAPPRGADRAAAPPGTGADVDDAGFRAVLGRHAAGVVVVTAPGDPHPAGITATSFTSVSLRPPLVSFYIDARSASWPVIRDAPAFAVNLLAEGQRDVAARFATRGVDRFAPPTRWQPGPEGAPLLAGASGHVVCSPHMTVMVGDHWLVVGRVTAAPPPDDPASRPLLYHRGGYGALGG
ncbi:flavin reductase family protein [Nocardiopsis coralliicola]